ncbi:ATP-binding protein [Natrialbaceae archaeon GCM10025810]|uniref:ATP-binding protein n=1 Tax=Halovalidus salilacus TaxID=3075124 RepID=UPI0036106EAF
MVKFSLPRNTATPVKFLGYFTVKDIARLLVPTTITAGITYNPVDLVGTLLGVLAGLLIGLSLVFLQIEGKTVDVHLFHFLRQNLVEKFSEPVEIDRVSDEYVLTSTGTAVGVVKVQPVPLSMQGEPQQKALHSVLAELYDTISFPIEVHSRQLPLKLDTYIEKISDKGETSQAQDYVQYLENLNQGNATTTHHYIVVRADKPGETQFRELLQNVREHYEQLEPVFEKIESYIELEPETESDNSETIAKLNHRIDVVVDQLNRGSLEATQVTGLELQQYAYSFNQQSSHDIRTYQLPDSQIGAYRRPLYITEYPANAELGWPVTLLNQSSNGRIDIIQRIEPRNQSKTVRKLERHIDRLDAEINSRLGGGLIKDIAELRTRREDAENMVSLAADNNQSLIDYSTYIVAHGDTPQQRDHAHTQAKTRLDTLLSEYQSPVFRTDQAVKTESLLYNDPLNHSRIMPSSSAASGFTFATSNQNEGSGIIYGTSTEDQSPVLLDLWNWSSHSLAILGKTGSGKSFYAKTLLLRWKLAYPSLEQIIVVDPKNEYGSIIEQLGGSTTTLNSDTDYQFEQRVQGFQVEERGGEDNAENLVKLVRAIYSHTSQNTGKTFVIIDEAHNILRRKKGREALEQFVREARDTQTSVVMISQNADDFASNLEGRNILKNLEATFLMRHSEVAEDVIDFFQLSTQETTELQKLKTGTKSDYSEALMKITDRLDSKVQITATYTEYSTITQGGGE